MQPGDRLVCAFVQPLQAGDTFKQWPLHVTVVPWFRSDLSSDDLAGRLEGQLQDSEPFEVVMDGEVHFGRNKLVNLVVQPTPFTKIEEQVRGVIKSHGAWIVDESTKAKRAFRPHVTAQKDERLQQADTFVCGQLYVVEQKGGIKQIVEVVELGNEVQA
jgi:2'-5' RNA ligase